MSRVLTRDVSRHLPGFARTEKDMVHLGGEAAHLQGQRVDLPGQGGVLFEEGERSVGELACRRYPA